MKRTVPAFLAILFILTPTAGALAAESGPGDAALQQQTGQPPPAAAARQDQVVLGLDSLVGRNVLSPRSDVVGEIRDLVIDMDTNRVEYVVVSTGGFFGYGDERVVPWRALRMQGPDEPFILGMTEEQLRNAPGDRDLANREEAGEIFDYFGLSPYWGEGVSEPRLQDNREGSR